MNEGENGGMKGRKGGRRAIDEESEEGEGGKKKTRGGRWEMWQGEKIGNRGEKS